MEYGKVGQMLSSIFVTDFLKQPWQMFGMFRMVVIVYCICCSAFFQTNKMMEVNRVYIEVIERCVFLICVATVVFIRMQSQSHSDSYGMLPAFPKSSCIGFVKVVRLATWPGYVLSSQASF